MFVKICGITTEEDALFATAMGADAVGFLFAPSPRQVSATQARDIAKRLPPEVLTVGVFRNEMPSRVVEIANRAGLKAVQLHGKESPQQVREIRPLVRYVIKAVAAGSREMERLSEYDVDAVLVDGLAPGSGELFDWHLVDGVGRGRPVILAGGLTPDNVAEAIRTVRPWGVDVSTGVERSPGVKDPLKVRAFIKAVRDVDAETAAEAGHDVAAPAGSGVDAVFDWRDEL